MHSRWLQPPRDQSFFLFGPRATGKTSWVRKTFPQAIYLDLREAETFRMLLSHPEALISFIPPQFSDWIILDEIQQLPNLLNEVHRLIESKRFKFVLLCSSWRNLKRKGVNLPWGVALCFTKCIP